MTDKKTLWRVLVRPRRPEWDALGSATRARIEGLGLGHLERVCSSQIYLIGGALDLAAVERIAAQLLADPVSEIWQVEPAGRPLSVPEYPGAEVHLKPGVMDPVADSVRLGIRDMNLDADWVATATRYELVGVETVEQLASVAGRALANDCIEHAYLDGFGRRDEISTTPPIPPRADHPLRRVTLIGMDDDALARLSRDGHLFLSPAEMRAVRDHFRSQDRDPTDLELETIAQTWSEHCVHKTLKSAFVYRGTSMPDVENPSAPADGSVTLHYRNLLADTIAKCTRDLDRNWCLSVFEDNAGIIAFDDEYGIAFKVETHNHPSAIEPYGGAATGVGGCVRDIMGCGLGAKPVANTDVFCVAPPDLSFDRVPRGVLHPRAILDGIVAGVRDYGNRMGIPTVNGALVFDERYLGNPLVYVGCVGLIPRKFIRKQSRPGDHIVLVGGRTGRDGIHGATFSSAELTDTHADEFSHAVQIGNPITEKKMLDCILQARDHERGCLYSAITDCGAGGLSSAVGEMGAHCGAAVKLDAVPLKYSGLRYDEMWISEAQERMVLSVPEENLRELLSVFAAEDVEATVIGEFTDDGLLTVRHNGVEVGRLEMNFLHEGVPRQELEAEWHPPAKQHRRSDSDKNPIPPGGYVGELKRRLASMHTSSREWIVRQYDHEVQGGAVVTPLVGPGNGPADAAVIRPRLDSPRGIAIGCGLCPEMGDEDPYWMAVAAVDEALRNVVCVGGDPARTAILDNFCWPKVDSPESRGALVRACQGAHDAGRAYGLPFISGKDSLNNEFSMTGEEAKRCGLPERLAIPYTLLISAVSIVEDVGRCTTSAARTDRGETTFWYVGHVETDWRRVALRDRLRVHRAVHKLIQEGVALAVHDVGAEGMAVTLAEMAIGGRCGISFLAYDNSPQRNPFMPMTGGYIVQAPKDVIRPIALLCTDPGFPPVYDLALSSEKQCLRFIRPDGERESIALDELDRAWKTGVSGSAAP